MSSRNAIRQYLHADRCRPARTTRSQLSAGSLTTKRGARKLWPHDFAPQRPWKEQSVAFYRPSYTESTKPAANRMKAAMIATVLSMRPPPITPVSIPAKTRRLPRIPKELRLMYRRAKPTFWRYRPSPLLGWVHYLNLLQWELASLAAAAPARCEAEECHSPPGWVGLEAEERGRRRGLVDVHSAGSAIDAEGVEATAPHSDDS
jgi:hypothetical protein